MKRGRGIDRIRENQEKVAAERRRLLQRLQEKRQASEQVKEAVRTAAEAHRTRFSSVDVETAIAAATRFIFLQLDAGVPVQLNRPTLELLGHFLSVLRSQQSRSVLQWPVGQSDLTMLHPLAMVSLLCTGREQITKGYSWCPAVRDFRTLWYPWRGSGTGADQRSVLIERSRLLKHNQLHVTRAWAGEPEASAELGLLHRTIAHLVGLSARDADKPHLAHPTLAEIYPTFGALGADSGVRPFAAVTRDLFGRVEHGAGLRKMVDYRAAIARPSTAPFAFFGICPRSDVARALGHSALNPTRGGRSPDVCLLDLGPPGLRRLGHGWEEELRRFLEQMLRLHVHVPVLAITQDLFVHRRLDLIMREVGLVEEQSDRLPSSVLFRSSDGPFERDPPVGSVSPVRFQFHSAGGQGAEALSAMSDAARACSDPSRAGALRFAMGDIRRAMNLPCGLDAAFNYICDAESQSAAEAFLERRSAGTAIATIRQCLATGVTAGERGAMTAAEHSVRKAFNQFAKDTPIGALLSDVVSALVRKSSRSVIVFGSETERRLGERRLLDDDTVSEQLLKRLSANFVRLISLSDVEAVLKEIEASGDRNSWKRIVVVTPSQARLSVLLGRTWLPEEVIVIADRDFVTGLARAYRGLAGHKDLAGEGRIGGRLAAAAKAARTEAEARDVDAVDLELAPSTIGSGQIIDLTGGDDDDGERDVIELALESGRVIRVRPGGLMIRHNPFAEVHPFERAAGRDIASGEAIVVPDATFVEEARAVLPVRVLAQGWVDVYHACVEGALSALPGDGLLAKARHVVEEVKKTGARKYSEAAVVDWLKVAEHKRVPREELRSHAPLRWREFEAFMQLLGHGPMAEKIWKEGIVPLRTDRRRAGVKMAQAFASVLVDPHGGAGSLAPEIKARIATLRARAFEHVDGVVECRRERAREGAVA